MFALSFGHIQIRNPGRFRNVMAGDVLQVNGQQIQGQRVRAEAFRRAFQFFVRATHAADTQQRAPGFRREQFQIDLLNAR